MGAAAENLTTLVTITNKHTNQKKGYKLVIVDEQIHKHTNGQTD